MRRPGWRVHLRATAHQVQRRVRAGSLRVGEVHDGLLVSREARRRSAGSLMCLGRELRVQLTQLQAPHGDFVGLFGVALNESDAKQPDQA